MNNLISRIPAALKNKYILSVLVFFAWMLFFDDRDVITTHFKYKNELINLEKSKEYYEARITETRKELDKLQSDPGMLEKYARERYRMKRDNEDLYIIGELSPE
ncbi:FtsB family cell division protein [Flavihumibacter profundi]|jgi:cell division protein DivIC|uniref:FtsB family cell division protein n=1 Tax=Flavihumibacter profundi TaxID=2716883 RepID=UPI001CC7E238|nr:septum formation initiator family protein [Flavihumibacter profundi]MBZ5857911.1 septum formation initiator family protein [Flavihumibacter profundi]